MEKTARTIAGMVMAAAIVTASTAAAATVTASAESPSAHVRSDSAAIAALVERASDGSASFRRLIDDVNASDGIVYIQEGNCPDGAPACFIGVTMAGSTRDLWVRVSLTMHDADSDVMGSIAHELRHTLEVLAVRSVRSTASMQLFYRRVGLHGSSRGYETQTAIDAGNAVRSEVRAFDRRAKTE